MVRRNLHNPRGDARDSFGIKISPRASGTLLEPNVLRLQIWDKSEEPYVTPSLYAGLVRHEMDVEVGAVLYPIEEVQFPSHEFGGSEHFRTILRARRESFLASFFHSHWEWHTSMPDISGLNFGIDAWQIRRQLDSGYVAALLKEMFPVVPETDHAKFLFNERFVVPDCRV